MNKLKMVMVKAITEFIFYTLAGCFIILSIMLYWFSENKPIVFYIIISIGFFLIVLYALYVLTRITFVKVKVAKLAKKTNRPEKDFYDLLGRLMREEGWWKLSPEQIKLFFRGHDIKLKRSSEKI